MGKIRSLIIYSPLIKKSRRILTLSDLHMGFNNKSNVSHIKDYECLKPDNFDFILMPGDIVHSGAALKNPHKQSAILNNLQSITGKTPTYMSIGNHEQYERKGFEQWAPFDSEYVKEVFETIPNIHIIENNEVVNLNDIEISAFNQDVSFYLDSHENYRSFLTEYYSTIEPDLLHPNCFSLFLIHDPKSIYSISKATGSSVVSNANLVVSGHMHNALMPNNLQKYFNGKGIIAPNFTLFPETAYGVRQVSDTIFLVNGAVSTFIEIPFINELYGLNCTIINLEPSEGPKLTYKYR